MYVVSEFNKIISHFHHNRWFHVKICCVEVTSTATSCPHNESSQVSLHYTPQFTYYPDHCIITGDDSISTHVLCEIPLFFIHVPRKFGSSLHSDVPHDQVESTAIWWSRRYYHTDQSIKQLFLYSDHARYGQERVDRTVVKPSRRQSKLTWQMDDIRAKPLPGYGTYPMFSYPCAR